MAARSVNHPLATGRLALAAGGFLLAMAFAPRQTEAHPLGLTSVNRYLGVRPHGQELEVDYLLDLAEMPAYAEIEALDVNHDSAVTPAERDRYLDGVRERVLQNVHVTVDGVNVPLREVFRSLDAPAGQNGLSTLRVVFEFRGALAPSRGARMTVHVHDGQYASRGGWRELAGLGSSEWALAESSLPAGDPRAGAGLAYPAGAIDAMPRQDDAVFTFQRGGLSATEPAGRGRNRTRESDSDGARLIGLLREGRGGWSFWLFALALAFGLGAGHALSPGHGKTLVGAWLVGSRASVRHALILGLTVTVTHTASVFALGLVALTVERTIGSEKLLRALEFTSGALVLGIAISQLPSRWRRFRGVGAPSRFRPAARVKHAMVRAVRERSAGFAHDHGDGRVHSHAVPEEISVRSLVALGVSGGMVPCPGALVVLLAAIAMHRIAAGLGLLVAFSLGLAFVLSALGALFVTARRFLDRVPTDGRIARTLPVLSSVVVMLLGAGIIARSLSK